MTRQPPVAPHHLPVLTEIVGHARSITPVVPQEAIVTPLSIPPTSLAPHHLSSTPGLEARIDALVEQRLRAVLEQTVLDKNSPFRSTLRQEIETLLKESV